MAIICLSAVIRVPSVLVPAVQRILGDGHDQPGASHVLQLDVYRHPTDCYW